MLRSATRKAMAVGRFASAVFGLALVLALVVGVGTTALAAVPGDPFKLGKTNTIDKASKLVGGATGALLTVDNGGSGSALGLQVEPGEAPMTVDSDKKVAELNSDEVDGKSADQIGVNGLELVEEDSATNSDSSKTERADCPDGKVLVGTGYELIGGTSGAVRDLQTDVVVTDVEPSTATDSVTVTAFEENSTPDGWLVRASALCATEGTP